MGQALEFAATQASFLLLLLLFYGLLENIYLFLQRQVEAGCWEAPGPQGLGPHTNLCLFIECVFSDSLGLGTQ